MQANTSCNRTNCYLPATYKFSESTPPPTAHMHAQTHTHTDKRKHSRLHIYTHTYIYIYLYIRIRVCRFALGTWLVGMRIDSYVLRVPSPPLPLKRRMLDIQVPVRLTYHIHVSMPARDSSKVSIYSCAPLAKRRHLRFPVFLYALRGDTRPGYNLNVAAELPGKTEAPHRWRYRRYVPL